MKINSDEEEEKDRKKMLQQLTSWDMKRTLGYADF
jgi:hypothetical protein